MANGGWKNILGERWVTRASIDIASGVSSITTRRFFGGGKYNLIALGGSYGVTGATVTISRSFLTPILISTTALAIGTSATPGAQSVTVPADAQLVIVHAANFVSGGNASLSLTSSFAGTFTILNVNNANEGIHVAHAVVSSTGAQTITPSWNTALTEGPMFFVSFVKNVNTSDYARQVNYAFGGSSSSTATHTISTTVNDLLLVMDKQDVTTPATMSGYTSAVTQNVNAEGARVQTCNSPGASSTTVTSVSTNFASLGSISIKPNVSGVYTLTANGGSYTLSGGTAVLLRTKNLIVSGGSYSLVGQNANLVKGRVLTSQGGSYTVGGASATLLRSKLLVASGGAYSYTGQTATLSRSKYLIAQGGTYNLTGQSVVITWTSGSTNYTLICQGGSYTLLGASANVNRNRNLTAQSGSYSLSGAAANIYRSKYINAVGGIYNLSGSSATILKSKYLAGSGGSYIYNGQQAILKRSKLLVASSGTYNLTGSSATITWTTVGGAVYPPVGSVLLGVTYGPTGTEYTGTLDIGKKFRIDIATGHIVMILDGDKVMSL